MQYVVLKALPEGQQPGEIIEEPEEVGHIFVLAGAARVATAEDLEPGKKTVRRYRRRDLVAES